MASLIDVSGLTLNAEEAREIGKLIMQNAFSDGELASLHDIETGVAYKTQIAFIGNIADGIAKSTGCVPNVGAGVTMSEKFWEPEIYDIRYTHCAADLNVLQKLFTAASKINPDFYNRVDSPEMGVIYALIEKMMKEAMPERVWFSDKTAAIEPTGVFTSGTNLGKYNVIDGLFKQIFAEVGTGDSNYVEITENSGASYAAQELPADAALGYLTKVMNSADSRLLEDGTAKLRVTRTIADNYRNTLRSKTVGAGFLEVVENGKPVLYFDGYEVVVMYQWDRVIAASQNDGTIKNLPHRIVFTPNNNVAIATRSTDDLAVLDSFYDQTLKSNIIDVAFSLDVKHYEAYKTVAAY
jgi:hypothetical protein